MKIGYLMNQIIQIHNKINNYFDILKCTESSIA